MSIRRAAAVARRILAGFRHDHRSLALVVVAPLAMTLLLAWVLRGSTPGSITFAIANQAGPAGDQLVSILEAGAASGMLGSQGPELRVQRAAGPDEARQLVRSGAVQVALILPQAPPAGSAGAAIPLTVITEGTDPGVDSQALTALQALVIRATTSLGQGLTPAIAIQHETIYLSPDADLLDVMAPVFLGYFAYFFVFLLTGISFLRERVGGTLERLLATPVTRGEIVVGYGLGFGLLAAVQVVLLTAFVLGRIEIPAIGPLGSWAIGLGVSSAGSPLLVLALVLALALGAVVLGIFLSTFARTELQVIQFIPIVIVPQGLLSGIFWPVDRLPEPLAAIARLLPVTYAVDGLRAIILRGVDLTAPELQLDLAVLLAVAIVFVVLASLTIKRDIA